MEVGYDAVGRPLVLRPAAALFCSVSGRGSPAALALSSHPVGIDIETLQLGDIAWAAFAPDVAGDSRRPTLIASPTALWVWNVKEFLKARGSAFCTIRQRPSCAATRFARVGVAAALHPSPVREVTFAGTIVIGACIAIH